MGRTSKHVKQLKSEKAKVKLKTSKKAKLLPKGLNVTNTSFKTKKIVIQEQLKQQDSSEILSRRKLNVKDLLSRLQHYSSTVRQEAVRELKELMNHHSSEIVNLHLNSLLQGICSLSLDKERDIRRESLKVLNTILSPISAEQLYPFCDILISYLNCSMTHINPSIKEDSLLFLDVLIQNCNSLLAQKSQKILPNFLEMISKLRTESQPGRQLSTNLNSRNTSVKWRIKVLSSLEKILTAIVQGNKKKKSDSNLKARTISASDEITYAPIYGNNLEICEINFGREDYEVEKDLSSKEFDKYIENLLPLMFDSWIEVCPKEKIASSESMISNEAAVLLKSILDITQAVIELLDFLESEERTALSSLRFKRNFQEAFVKTLMMRFPYEEKNASNPRFNNKKRQGDFSESLSLNESCLEQNLGICHVFIWFSRVQGEKKSKEGIDKELCGRVLEVLNDKLENWSSRDASALPQFMRTLRTLFLRASKVWYKNGISLEETLKTLISAHARQSRKEFQSQCFSLLSDIVMDHNLKELHAEEEFKKFIKSLPSLLLKKSIQENEIQLLNTIVLRYRNWIQEELIKNQEAIIDNAKRIEILGSENDRSSRLMICNLFYFIDNQVYH